MNSNYLHGFMCGYLRKTANVGINSYNPTGPKPMTLQTDWSDLSEAEQGSLNQMQNQISPNKTKSITGSGWNQMDPAERQEMLGQIRTRQGSLQPSIVVGT